MRTMISEVKQSSNVITIPSMHGRTRTVLLTGFCTAVAVIVALAQPTPQWARHASSLALYLAVVASVSAGLLCWGWRTGVRFDGDGLTIRYFFRTRRLGWHEVSRFADGCTGGLGEGGGHVWALDVVLHDGKVVTVKATARDSRRSEAKVLAAVLQAAERYGIQAPLTGILSKRRSRASAEEPVPSPEAGGIILSEWVTSREFSTTRLRPGYDIEEVDAFVEAIRQTFLGIREPSLTTDEIRNKQFSTTRLRPGYDEEEVDAFLDVIELRLAAQVSDRRGAPAARQGGAAADLAAGAVPIRCLECAAESAGTAQVCARCGAPLAQQPSLTLDAAAGGSAGSLMLPHELVGQRTNTGSRRNVLVMAGVVTALTVSLLIVGLMSLRSSTRSEASTSALSTSAPPQLTVDQLQPGDCLRGSDMGLDTDSAWPDLVTAVPCTQQHIAEVFFVGNAWPQSLAAYPGDDAVNTTADGRCDTAFAAYDGASPDGSGFTYDSIAPDSSTWPDGDRSLICIAYKPTSQYPGGAAVNYSIKGSGQ
jgi:DivIVA domain-containing protein